MRKTCNAIYVRQSVEKKDSISLESQITACLTENHADQYRIYQDQGFSGSNTNRPGYTEMMRDIRAGMITGVIVYRLDRLSRSVGDFSRMWEIFDSYDVTFTSVSERFDTSTPIGKAMIYIIMTFAQLERETIAERISDNYKSRLAERSWPGGKAPFGFRNEKISKAGKIVSTLVPDKYISLVKYIFEHYGTTDCTLSALAQELESMGVVCGKRTAWDNVALSRILRSPVYVSADSKILDYYIKSGFVNFTNSPEEYDGSSSAHITGRRSRNKSQNTSEQCISLTNFSGVVDPDTWLLCQYKLAQNKSTASSPSRKHTWLTGLLKCAYCGYSLVAKHAGSKLYLCCSGRYNLKICHVSSISLTVKTLEQLIEERLLSVFLQLAKSTDFIPDPAIYKIELEIEALMKSAHLYSPVTASYIDKKIRSLTTYIINLKQNQTPMQYRLIIDFIDSFPDLPFESKYQTASVFIEKISVCDNIVTIHWK